MSLLVVGSVAFDALESPFGKVDRVVGGAATYFAVAASFFAHVSIVAIEKYFAGGTLTRKGWSALQARHSSGRGAIRKI